MIETVAQSSTASHEVHLLLAHFRLLADQEKVPAGDSTQVHRQHIKLDFVPLPQVTVEGETRHLSLYHLSNLLERVSRLLAD